MPAVKLQCNMNMSWQMLAPAEAHSRERVPRGADYRLEFTQCLVFEAETWIFIEGGKFSKLARQRNPRLHVRKTQLFKGQTPTGLTFILHLQYSLFPLNVELF